MRWFLPMIAVWLVTATAWSAQLIVNTADLAAVSSAPGDTYIMNPGDYAITGTITLTGTSVPNLSFSTSSLTVDNAMGGRLTVGKFTAASSGIVGITAGTATALTAAGDTVFGGSVTADINGGGTANTAGLQVTSGELLITGSASVTAQASTGYGIWISRTARQDGGTLKTTGGSAASSYGFYASRGYTMTGGTINTHGGSADRSYGLYGGAYSMTMSGGEMNAYAGTAAGAYGARINTIILSGDAIINAYGYTDGGSSLVGAYGLYGQTLTVQDNGTLNAYSGAVAITNDDSRGVYFYTINQSGGTINAFANAATPGAATNIYNYAIYTYSFNQSGGTATAEGNGVRSVGLRAASTFRQSGNGIFTATGGSGNSSYGLQAGSIAVDAGSLSTLIGQGGDGVNSFGITTDKFTQAGGSVTGTGGSGNSVTGISGSSLTLSGTGQFTGIVVPPMEQTSAEAPV